MSSIDQGGGKRRSGMGNHFSNRHSPNSSSMASTANPASKTTGPNQSIFVAFATPHCGRHGTRSSCRTRRKSLFDVTTLRWVV